MKGVWEALHYCIENKEDDEDCFGYWWDGWVGENKCYDCGEGIMEVKLHTEYPCLICYTFEKHFLHCRL